VDQIVLRIKRRNFFKAIGELTADPTQQPVWRPFIADMIVTYAFEMPQALMMLPQREMSRLGLTLDSLHKQALTHLCNNRTIDGKSSSLDFIWAH